MSYGKPGSRDAIEGRAAIHLPDMSDAPSAIRHCDGCTMCCRVMGIAELDKPAGVWCPHAVVGRSCRIYEARPTECRTFNCLYLLDEELNERWKPSEAKFCIVRDAGKKRLIAYMDPHRPDAWRREPYHSQFRAWAKEAAPLGRQVIIGIGERRIALLPDREIDLGHVGPDDFIVTQRSARGWEAFVDKREPVQ